METKIFSDPLLLIALLLITIILIVAIFLALKANYRISDLERRKKHQKKSPVLTVEKHTVDQGLLNKLLERITELEKKESLIETSRTVTQNNYSPAPSLTPIIHEELSPEINLDLPKPPGAQSFYMPTPNQDGSFDMSNASEAFRPTVSLFKFTLDTKNNSKASFEFFSDDLGIKDVLTNPKTYLEPVCQEANNPFPGAKRIITLKRGVAMKIGDKWIIAKDDRANIKYE